MSRKELQTAVQEAVPALTKGEALAAVNAVLEAVIAAVKTGNGITLAGFGTFSTKITKARLARNPKTGALVQVPSKSTVRFKPSASLVQTDGQ